MPHVSLDLPPEAGAAGRARRWAREQLRGAVPDDTLDAVELVLTELVQNAVFHAGTPMTVALGRAADDGTHGGTGSGGVRVTVRDGSRVLPSSGLTDAEAMSGRGLLMVTAVATAWGVEPTPDGKVVWADLPARPAHDDGDEADVDDLLERWSDAGGPTPLQQGDGTTLVVRDLPTATMLAVKTHNDDVFRELALVSMSDEAAVGGPADLSGVAKMARDVLVSFADGRQQVRNQVLDAVQQGSPTFDLVLAVDERAGSVLPDYLEVLERADEWSAQGLLLSEPPPAEVLAVRRRYLSELISGLADR